MACRDSNEDFTNANLSPRHRFNRLPLLDHRTLIGGIDAHFTKERATSGMVCGARTRVYLADTHYGIPATLLGLSHTSQETADNAVATQTGVRRRAYIDKASV